MEEYNNGPERQFRLLVVEDDSTLLQLIEKKLPGEGLEIETARDGASAIEIIRGNPPDLLLLDYLLSDMDGSRLIEYIRGKGLEIPFIIMTGFGDEQVAVNLMKLGAHDYVIKDPNFLSLLPVAVGQARNSIVTKQKLLQAQKALSESEYNYRILVESSRDMIFTTDLNGRFLFVNSNFETITGFSRDELLGKSFIDLIEQDFLEVAQEKFVSGLTGKEIPFFQANFIAKSGKIIPMELNITVLYDSAKARKGMLGIGRDVSHRKRYEETLRQNEEYFRTLIQNSSDAIVILNGNGTFRFVSNSLQSIIGYTPEDLESKKLFDIIHQKDIVKALNFFWEVVQNSDQDSTFEIVFNHKDGSARYVEGIGRNMINNPVVNGIYLTLRDLESRKRLEEQLVNAQKMEAVGRLAGGIAHDFNNIMTAIINYSEVIIKSNPENDNLINLVLKIIGSAKEAANFTTQLLAFSSKQMYMPKVTDLNGLLSELRLILSKGLPEYITLGFSPGINTLNVSIDKNQFEKVVKNLVDNAADAITKMKDFIVKGVITLECDTMFLSEEDCRDRRGAYTGSFARLTVKDNGIGIAEENLNHLFEPFFSTKQGDPGVGMGLAVAYGIVKQHKGWIEVHSRPNEGSEFSVFIPVFSDRLDAGERTAAQRFEYKGSGERILLVEDEESVRRLVTESLRNSGFTVLPAVDAKEAQKIYKKEKGKFDIIFSDVALPDKTGVDFVNETIKDDKTGVILTSGYFDETWTLSPFAGRNYRFIAKPYVLETLLKCIKEVLELKQKN